MGAKRKIFYLAFGVVEALILAFVLGQGKLFIEFSKAGVTLWTLLVSTICFFLFAMGLVIILSTSLSALMTRPRNWKVPGIKFTYWSAGFIAGIIIGLNVVWARSIDISQAGTAFWTFIIIGIIIVLLQLIPAAILFFSFVGYTVKQLHEKIPALPKDEKEECKGKCENK